MPTPTATSTQLTTDCSNRTSGPLNMIVLHHAATTDLQAILNLFQPGGRQVSAHRAIKDAQNVETVPEAKRAWSLSDAYWDSRAFTVECANESTQGWTISAASHETLAQQCASWAKRHNFPIIRSGDPKTWTLIGHREVYTIWGGSYATACPGGMNLDWIASRANQILARGGANEGGGMTLNGAWRNTSGGIMVQFEPGCPLYAPTLAEVNGYLAPSNGTWAQVPDADLTALKAKFGTSTDWAKLAPSTYIGEGISVEVQPDPNVAVELVKQTAELQKQTPLLTSVDLTLKTPSVTQRAGA
jgi:hypothetical protein